MERRQLLACLALTGVAGCSQSGESGSTSPTNEPTPAATPTATPTSDAERELFVYWDGAEPWWDKFEKDIVPGFANGRDISVETHFKTGHREDWFEGINTSIDGGNPPGVYFDELSYLAEFLTRDQIHSVDSVVDDLVAANGDLIVESPTKIGDTFYLVPHELVPGGILQYREDIYDELSLSVPETWGDLLANARAIDEANQFDARGFAVSAPPEEKADQDFTNWFYNAGGKYFRWADDAHDEVEVDFRERPVRRALEFMQELADFSPDPAEMDRGTLATNWRDGTIAQCLHESTWLALWAPSGQ